MADFQIEKLNEYLREGMHVAEFEYGCPQCGERHKQRVTQADPIMMVTVEAPCGFRAPVALPMLEPERGRTLGM
jgi:hypothetical protein